MPGDEPGTYVVPALTGSWSRATIGLEHPARPDERRPITFDHELARDRTDVVLAHLGHPLVRMALALLRAEVWGTGHHLHRVTIRYADPSLGAPVAVAHGRLVITGASGHRLHEQLIFAGAAARRASVPSGSACRRPTARSRSRATRPVPPTLRDQLIPRAAGGAEPLRAALQARAGDRARQLTATLARRARGGAGARRGDAQRARGDDPARGVRRARRSAAADHRPRARRRRPPPGRARPAVARGRGSTRSPARSSAEQAAIARRYADPAHRLFPAAVTLLVPEGARL